MVGMPEDDIVRGSLEGGAPGFAPVPDVLSTSVERSFNSMAMSPLTAERHY